MRSIPACLITALAALATAAPAAHATTFTVNSTGDDPDASVGNNVCATAGGQCTLRAAIQEGNATPGAAPHRIRFTAGVQGNTITVSTPLDPIAVPGTPVNGEWASVDGCSDALAENTAATQPCVGLRSSTGSGTGLSVDYAATPAPLTNGVRIRGLAITNFDTGIQTTEAGTVVHNNDFGVRIDHTTVEGNGNGVLVFSSGARIGGANAGERNVFAGNDDGVRIWGGDTSAIQGNLFGVLRDGVTAAANERAIRVTSLVIGPSTDEAVDNLIGGGSDAAVEDTPCTGECNVIARSTIAGIDLEGTSNALGGDGPSNNTSIFGNWIGLDAAGNAAGNAKPVIVGDADPWIGALESRYGNLISANGSGVDQAGGQGFMVMTFNVFGLSPDHGTSLPNAGTNATVGGKAGSNAYVQGNLFGSTGAGLVLTGPAPDVIGNYFAPPDGTGSYATAALVVEPGAQGARIGSHVPGGVNLFGGTAAGVPALLIKGADDVRVVSNCFGSITCFLPPLTGPAIRITDGPGGATTSGAQIGEDDLATRNRMVRTTGPAIEVSGGATGVVVAENEGHARDDFFPVVTNADSLFTDLLPVSGLGNSGGVNGGIQPPVVDGATTAGIAGSATPGAVVRILQQWRADPNPQDSVDEPYWHGYTLPTTSALTTAGPDGRWGLAYAEKLPEGQKVAASQTTGSGSSEYTPFVTVTRASDLPAAAITGGPTGVVAENTATFTFSTPSPGATLECALDDGAFAGCTSPMTVGPLEPGTHQFRVRARLGATFGLPVSRTWTIDGPTINQAPAPPPPAPPKAATPAPKAKAAVKFSKVVRLPSTRRCVKGRKIRLRLRPPSGTRMILAEFRIKRKKKRTVTGGGLKKAINLRHLPKRRRVKVSVRVVLSTGKVMKGSRTYTQCKFKKKSKKKSSRKR